MAITTKSILAKHARHESDVTCLRNAVQNWFFTVMDMLNKIHDSAFDLKQELAGEPEGILSKVMDLIDISDVYEHIYDAREALQRMTVSGPTFLWTPNSKALFRGSKASA